MENFEEKAIELIERFEALATELAPEVLELGLMAARVSATQAALIFVTPFAVFIWSVRKPLPMFKLGMEIENENGERRRNNEEFPQHVGGTIYTVVAVISGIITLTNLSIWPFVGIFYPELWIAKQVLGW